MGLSLTNHRLTQNCVQAVAGQGLYGFLCHEEQ